VTRIDGMSLVLLCDNVLILKDEGKYRLAWVLNKKQLKKGEAH